MKELTPINQGFSVVNEDVKSMVLRTPEEMKVALEELESQKHGLWGRKLGVNILSGALTIGTGGMALLAGWGINSLGEKMIVDDAEQKYKDNKGKLELESQFHKELAIADGQDVKPTVNSGLSSTQIMGASIISGLASMNAGSGMIILNNGINTLTSELKEEKISKSTKTYETSRLGTEQIIPDVDNLVNAEVLTDKNDKLMMFSRHNPDVALKIESSLDYIREQRRTKSWNSENMSSEDMKNIHKFDTNLESSLDQYVEAMKSENISELIASRKDIDDLVMPVCQIMEKQDLVRNHGYTADSGKTKTIEETSEPAQIVNSDVSPELNQDSPKNKIGEPKSLPLFKASTLNAKLDSLMLQHQEESNSYSKPMKMY